LGHPNGIQHSLEPLLPEIWKTTTGRISAGCFVFCIAKRAANNKQNKSNFLGNFTSDLHHPVMLPAATRAGLGCLL
jgi:hypothetical protein